MADRKPAKLVGPERETLLSLLRFQRESVVRKVAGIAEGDARRAIVPSGTTLLWLVKHLAYAESIWVEWRFLGGAEKPDDTVVDSDTLAGAVAAYEATWARVDAIVAASSLDDLCRQNSGDDPADLRWVLMHLLEETARHAGHVDILCELLDGRTGR